MTTVIASSWPRTVLGGVGSGFAVSDVAECALGAPSCRSGPLRGGCDLDRTETVHRSAGFFANQSLEEAMWQNLMSVEIPILEKIIRTVLVYLLILVIFRVIGKRAVASLNTMDFVVMFLLSNVVQNAIIGPDNSFLGGAIGAVTLIAVNALVDRLAYRYEGFRWLVEGADVQVIEKGEVDGSLLRRIGLRRADLEHAVRVQNGDDVAEVWDGLLDSSGHLVLTLKESEQDASVKDIQDLKATLARMEQMLAGLSGAPAR
jgi:uncharacterized membrane protein YcaP (DUF421 family)